MPEIREMQQGEYAFLKEMLYEAIYFPSEDERLPRSIVDEPDISKYVSNFGKIADHALVLANGSELIGAAWARQFTEDDNSYGFINDKTPELSIAILEPYRNKGFGRQMIDLLIKILRANGAGGVSLSVDKKNPAFNLYRRMGFEIVAEQGTAYTMLRKL